MDAVKAPLLSQLCRNLEESHPVNPVAKFILEIGIKFSFRKQY